jgi:hypothetical protein
MAFFCTLITLIDSSESCSQAPELASLALLGLALTGVAFVSRGRKQLGRKAPSTSAPASLAHGLDHKKQEVYAPCFLAFWRCP